MKNVKRTFFLTSEETEQQRKVTNISNIAQNSPHYEMEDGEILYGMRYTDGITWRSKP